jgi:phenylalanyl-tRNA synthetase beta chain
MLSQPVPRQNPAPIHKLKQEIMHALIGLGVQEIVTYSLVGLDSLKKLTPEPLPIENTTLRVANPMTADQEYLRPNIRANLLAGFIANRRHEDGAIRLFELDKVYLKRAGDLPDERYMLCGVLGGPRAEKAWYGGGETVDFFDAKGVIESLFDHLGLKVDFEKSNDDSLHPNKQATIVCAGQKMGVIGEFHPKVLAAFEVAEPVYLFEVDVTSLTPCTVEHKRFQPIPKFPAVTRDIALVVDSGVTHKQILDIIKSFPLVVHVALFDVYSGEQVPQGKKSLAYRLAFQSPDHTLTDEEANTVQKQILDRLSKDLGATLRA